MVRYFRLIALTSTALISTAALAQTTGDVPPPTRYVTDENGVNMANRTTSRKERVADNEYEALVKRVHKVIADAGSAGIDGKELSRKSQFLDRRKRADVVAHLEEAGMIRGQVFQQPAGERGRPRTIYFDIA